MTSVQHLRDFISERLNAAAEAIFTEFEKTIVQYEEELDRQRKLQDIIWKAQGNVPAAEVQHQHVRKVNENDQDKQQFCNQTQNSNQAQERPESAPIKDEEEGLLTSLEEELLLKDEPDDVSISAEENINIYHESNGVHIPSPIDGHSHSEGSRDSKPDKCCLMKTDKVSPLLKSHNTPFTVDKKQYYCKVCGETFENQKHLTVHLRFHKDKKLYSCQTCGKSFSTNSHLLRHIKIHTGEKPFSCKTCGKCFHNTSDCLRHVRIHTGEKPYSCKTCGKCFSQNSAKLRHMKTHSVEKPHSCPRCGRRFSTNSDCLRHMRTHKGGKPYFLTNV